MTFFSSRVMPRLVLPAVDAIAIDKSSREIPSVLGGCAPPSSERGLKTQPTKQKMTERAGQRHRDNGIMTLVLGALRKRCRAWSVSAVGSADPLQVFVLRN